MSHDVEAAFDARESIEKEKQESIIQLEDAKSPDNAGFVIDPHAERRLVRKIDMRMLSVATIIYLFSFIDRNNVGNARILNKNTGDDLLQTLHLSDNQYLIGLMVFFIAYTLFEVPSTYYLKKFRPSRWFSLLMLLWGAMTMTIAATQNFAGLIVTRFLLGAFEAGLFPGIVYCLTFWYKPSERAARIAFILAGATLGGAFGSAIAFGIGQINGAGGLQAWRWLMIIEGAPSVLAVPLIYFFYPDYPESVRWLSQEERELAAARIAGVASLGHAKLTWADARAALTDWRIYLHHALWVCYSVAFSSISLFAPTIVQGLGFEGLSAQLFTVPPYAIAFVVVLSVARLADRFEARAWAVCGSFLICGISFAIQGALSPTAFTARYALLCVSVSFAFSIAGPQLSWFSGNLRNTSQTTLGIPLHVSIATFGQIIGLFIYKSNESPSFPTGHFTNAAVMFTGAILTFILRAVYVRRNGRLARGEPPWKL
ncbi:MFS general substrate transporter [Epithele typhae]|uniref:MFS general substrate transporter n=1 Tax=Epithele typhae TaxID=378194 RepID=UPI002008C931|nr:MFS general substrate transporter [Epithele typhae]KAH9929502.1 MFS general substrate transporter [Epithele typhae]